MRNYLSFLHHALRRNWFSWFSGLFFIAFFALTCYLYGLPMGVVGYPAAVYGCFMVIVALIRSYREYRRHLEICKLQNYLPQLPENLYCRSQIEKDYENLCRGLAEYVYSLQTATENRFNDMNDYYAVWVHQIKTPISSMKLTLQTQDSDVARRLTLDLNRIEQYVEMVLTYLRLESKSTDYVVRAEDLDAIVRTSLRKFSSDFINRKLSLNYETLNRTVVTDSKWFSFVFEQILSNALKYTVSGSISVFLDEQDRLCIQDTGMGISPADLPRIFENGYTGLNGRLDTHSTGIGLFLCKRICNNLNHELTIESEVEKGTTVRIGTVRK